MSQIALGMKIGIDQSLISKYESGERLPTVQNLLIFAALFGTSLDYLMDLTDDPVPYPRRKA